MQSNQLAVERTEAEQLASVASSFLRLRPRLLAPAGPILLYLLHASRIPTTQFFCILLNFVAMLGFFSWEAFYLRGRTASAAGFARSLMLTVIGLSSVCAFSGGLSSPFLPILFAPIGIAFAAFGRAQNTLRIVLVLAVGLTYLALGRFVFPWPAITSPYVEVMTLVGTLVSTALLYFGVTGLANAFRGTRHALQTVRVDLVEAAQQRKNELQTLGSQVAHEIKNPLASIKGLVGLMHSRLLAAHPGGSEAASNQGVLSSDDSERFVKRLAVVLQEVSRMERVLTDYLDFARPLGELRPRHVELKRFLLELGELLSGQAEQAGVEVRVECPNINLEFDPERIQQALLNLTQNALLAMPDGGTLTLSAVDEGREVCIAVVDTGPGMSPNELARIKEPYFSKRRGGTGLGVVIADAIMAQHGGRLAFESKRGAGTVARARLPVQEDAKR